MLNDCRDIFRVTTVVTLTELTLVVIQFQTFGNIQFCLRKSMLADAFCHTNSSNQTTKDIILPTAYRQRERLLHTAEEEGRGTSCSTLVRRKSLLAQLGQTVVDHGTYQVVDITATQIFLVVLLCIRRDITLLIEMTQHHRLFLILLNVNDHLVVIADGIVFALGRILGSWNLREELLDFLLHLVNVHIAHNDDGLQVGTIPLMVVVAQVLIREVVDDIHRTDRHAVFILRTLIDLRHRLLHQSLHGTSGTSCTPFFMNHATLLVNLLVIQQQIVAPVIENKQTGVSNAFALQRH